MLKNFSSNQSWSHWSAQDASKMMTNTNAARSQKLITGWRASNRSNHLSFTAGPSHGSCRG